MGSLLLALALLGAPRAGEPLLIAGEAVAPAHAPPADAAEVEARALALARGLRCPVCQGLSVADSSSDAAVNMKNRIRDLIAEGYDESQIEAYFIDRYGTWVLLEPPEEGVNRLLYVVPGLSLALAGLGLGLALGRRRAARPPAPAPTLPDDPYARRVLDALED